MFVNLLTLLADEISIFTHKMVNFPISVVFCDDWQVS